MTDIKKMKKACGMAAALYQSNLAAHATARDYVKRARGLSDETINKLGIGYSQNEWTALAESLPQEIMPDALEASVLSQSSNGRVYDFFRHRLMFPICDADGDVVAFGGRALANGDSPKYLNSPTTTLFDKKATLYNFNNARHSSKEIIVTEGYMDVAMGVEHGINNMVGTLGTAFTKEHAALLAGDDITKITFCFDGDRAGRDAAKRTLAVCGELREFGITPQFCFMPDGTDPDDFIHSKGKDAFLSVINSSYSLNEYIARMCQESIKLRGANSIDVALHECFSMKQNCDIAGGSLTDCLALVTHDREIGYAARKAVHHVFNGKAANIQHDSGNEKTLRNP